MRFGTILKILTITFLLFLLSQSVYTYADHTNLESLRARRQAIMDRVYSRLTKTPTPSQSVQATKTPTPTKKPNTPTPTSSQSTTSIKDFIVREINDYRKSQGLSTVTTDSYTCAFAKTRAQEISSSFNHDGFRSRINSKSLPYPSYSEVTENIAMNSNYQNVVDAWIASSGHAENMRRNTPFVCVEKFGSYYAYEGWKP